MPIKYHLIKKSHPRNPQAPKRYYASLQKRGMVTLDRIADEISRGTALSTTDVAMVLHALTESVPRYLTEGQTVNLGEFGAFFLNVSSESVDEPEQFHARMIKNVKVRFRPGNRFKTLLKEIRFEKEV